MPSSRLGQKSGEESETLTSMRTTPRPSLPPTDLTQGHRPSIGKQPKRPFPTVYTTPHDSVLSELQGNFLKGSLNDVPPGPASVNKVASPGTEFVVVPGSGESTLPAPQQTSSRFTSSDFLIDPFDGSNLGVLAPQGQGYDSQNPSQINLANNPESGPSASVNANPAGTEAVWLQLSRVLDLQSEISKMHLEMETIGLSKAGTGSGAGDWKSKRKQWKGQHMIVPDSLGAPNLGPGLNWPRQRAMSTVSTISSSDEQEGDEPSVNVNDEEKEKNRIRGEEFVKLSSQFEGRKEAIRDIMTKLDDLSQTLSNFHALPSPNIDFLSLRNSSSGVASPARGSSPPDLRLGGRRSSRNSLSPAPAITLNSDSPMRSATAVAPSVPAPPLHRAKSETAADIITSYRSHKNGTPTLLVNSPEPEDKHPISAVSGLNPHFSR